MENQFRVHAGSLVRTKKREEQRQNWRCDYSMGPKSIQEVGPEAGLQPGRTAT